MRVARLPTGKLVMLLRLREFYNVELAQIDYAIKTRAEDVSAVSALETKREQFARELASIERLIDGGDTK